MTGTADIKIHADERWINGWPCGGESLWGEKLGPRKARLANVPFFTKDLAIDDIVELGPDGYEIVRIIERSRYSHFVLIAGEGVDLKRIDDVVKGFFPDARCEGGFETVFVVDIDTADVKAFWALARILKRQKLIKDWEQPR